MQPSSSFSFLAAHGPLYVQLATIAEKALSLDPTLTLVKLRMLAEAFARHAAVGAGLLADKSDSSAHQVDLLRALEQRGVVKDQTAEVFHNIRRLGNRATHDFLGSRQDALEGLRLAHVLAIWFHRTFADTNTKANFKPGPYVLPVDPATKLLELTEAAAQAKAEAEVAKATTTQIAKQLETQAALRTAEEALRKKAEEDGASWAAIALGMEADLKLATSEQQKVIDALALQVMAAPKAQLKLVVASSAEATKKTELDEASTRVLIDGQLTLAGWDANTKLIRWSLGVRPQKGKRLAIAEVPTWSKEDGNGKADYVLFDGLTPLAAVEAKKKNKNVASAIDQAKRYGRGLHVLFEEKPVPLGLVPPVPTGTEGFLGWSSSSQPDAARYAVPFLYSANGRHFVKQLESESGIWFLDARKTTSHARPILGFHSAEALSALLAHDPDVSYAKLKAAPADTMQEALKLRPYQVRAITAVEEALEEGNRQILVAMATGTGKTRTVIALIHRLLKTQRFERVLFLVDRQALGKQAHDAFNEMQLENLQSFAKNYDVMGLEGSTPDAGTKVHIATVQGLAMRILAPSENNPPPNIDKYDCIIVDESHRGYTLDQEMTEGEQELRGFEDYVSSYRRVLEYFDAVKIGLTATPAQHTVQIFGLPVFKYAYPEAVADGFLVDHEPPIRITTALSKNGITFKKGENVATLMPGGMVQLSLLPDEMSFEVESFNRQVITDGFNRAVAEELAKHLDVLDSKEKTIVFCVDDDHAERFTLIMKEALEAELKIPIDDGMVKKITGKTDRPLDAIKHFKTEEIPKIAVTVDLLTTGIDVPRVANLVFLRRIRSRILYDQMIGRATRLCPEIGKSVFRIFDAVDLYSSLAPVSEMKPVVKDVTRTTTELIAELVDPQAQELAGEDNDATHADDLLTQIVEKLRRTVRRIAVLKNDQVDPEVIQALEATLGCSLNALPDTVKALGTQGAVEKFKELPTLMILLDKLSAMTKTGKQAYIAPNPDEVLTVEHGYGAENKKPADYLNDFLTFIEQNKNIITALNIVCTKPRDLTRAQLRDLTAKLIANGYGETALRRAYSDLKNEEIAATVIGFIRQRALGSPLMPYEQRVDRGLKRVLASATWTTNEKKWLDRIALQMKKDFIVDDEAFKEGAFASAGGYKVVDKVMGGKLKPILDQFADAIWDDEEKAA